MTSTKQKLMYNLNQNEWANIIYTLVLLSFLVSGLFIRSNSSKIKMLKHISVWLGIIFIGVVLYGFKNQVIKSFLPYEPIITNGNKFEIQKSSNGHFYLTVKINKKSVLFMVDTGASQTTLSLKDANRIGINIGNLKFNTPYSTANGVIYGASTKISEIKIANLIFQDVWVSINRNGMGTSLLGMNFLDKFKGYAVLNDRLIIYY